MNGVRFNREMLTIEVDQGRGGAFYEIDLERCNTPAQMLDWIYQLHGKAWVTATIMYEILGAFERACREVFGTSVQGLFCPGGTNQRVDWKAGR
jgi:putative alpha-1,2-mannosidase